MALSSQVVHSRLAEAARRLRLSRSGRFVMFGTAISLFVLGAALLLDAYFHFGTSGRWTAFCLMVAPLLSALGLALHAWRRPISEASVARRIESAAAGSQNVLISAVQFERELPTGSALRKALFAEMVDPFPQVQWRDVFDVRLLQRLAAGLGAVVSALIVWAIISPAHFANSAARLFLPASSIAPLTRTQIVAVTPGDAQVIHGSELALTAKLGGEVPANAWVSFRELGSSWQKMAMNREVGQPVFTYHWKEVSQPMEFFVAAGDGRSAVYRVLVRPKTAIRAKVAEIEPPAYTKLGKFTVNDFTVLQNVLPGSRVAMTLALTYPLAELRATAEPEAPFTVDKVDGTRWQITGRVGTSEAVKLSYRDTDDHADSESFQIAVKPDEPPKIQIADPAEGKQLVASRDATVEVTFTATDDFGLGAVALYRSTAKAQDAELVQEWKDAAGQRSFTASAAIPLRQFKAGDEGRLSFVLIAKDQNDVSGPGVTISRPIVITTQADDQMQQQTAAATSKLARSLEDLVKLQQTNLDETRGATRATEGGADKLAPLLDRQVEIGNIGGQLAASTEGMATSLRVTLRTLSQHEMKAAVLKLRNAAGAAGDSRAKFLGQAIEVEQVILARLQGTPDMVQASVQSEQVKDVLAGVEELLRREREVYRDTKQATEASAPALSGRQDALADQSVKVRAGLAKSAQAAPLADREFTGRLVKAAAMFGEFKIYEDMLSAAEKLQAKRILEATAPQVQAITNLTKVIEMLNEARFANATEEVDKLKETLDEVKDKLSKLEFIQRDVVEKSKDQARKDEFDANDKATAQEIKITKDLMSQVIEQMLTDAHVLPDFKPANELRAELVSIYEDVIQADKKEAEAGKLKADEIAVQKEDSILEGLEKAKKIADDMEMWLPKKNDTAKWLLENFDTHEMPKIPMLPLHDFFEDLVGKLLDEQKDLADQANDANSNQLMAENDANGWEVADGPQGSFGAQGRSGNQAPNKNEQTGRSSGGRQGESNGEMAGDTAKNLEGSKVDTRRTKDPLQKGEVKSEDSANETKATGGGKVAGFSDRQGMEGNAPLRRSNAPRQLAPDALSVEQELLREKAAKTYAQATLLYLHANALPDVVQLMDSSSQALKEGRLRDFNGLHRQIVQRLTALKGNVTAGEVLAVPESDRASASDKQLAAGDEGAVPAQYKEMMADYYRSLVQEK